MTANLRTTQSSQPVSDTTPPPTSLLETLPAFVVPLVLAVATILIYVLSLNGEFLVSWDDARYIQDNPRVQSFSELPTIWTSHYDGEYIPVTQMSWLIDRTLWGDKVLGYHLVNVLLHVFNVLLVYWCLDIIQNRQGVAILAALLFAVHPLQVESVAWMSQRKVLLGVFFLLIALYLHIFSLRKKGRMGATFAAWGFFALSLLSRQTAILAPLVFISMDMLWAKHRFPQVFVRNGGYIAIAIIGFVISLLAYNAGNGQTLPTGSPFELAQLGLHAIGDYVGSVFLPVNLNNLYIYDLDSTSLIDILHMFFGLLSLLLTGVILYWQPLGRSLSIWTMLWFWAFMVPALNIYFSGIVRADRYMYLPAIMLYAGLAVAFFRLWEQARPELRYGLMTIIGGVLVGCLFFTITRIGVWENEETLWRDHLEDHPESLAGLHNLGTYYARVGQIDQAMATFDTLLEYHPSYAIGNSVRGALAMLQGDYTGAASYYDRALRNDPTNADYAQSLGIALLQAGVQAYQEQDYESALGFYGAANDYIPTSPILHNNIGYTLYELGDFAGALVAYNRAIELDQTYTRAWINVGDAALRVGSYPVAANAYNNALVLGGRLNANNASNFCLALGEMGVEPQRAISFCQQALDSEPNNGLYLGRAAHVLLVFGEFQSAVPVAEKAVQVAPDLALNQRVLGDAYAQTGNYEGARAAYTAALSLNPNNQQALLGIAALDAGQVPPPPTPSSPTTVSTTAPPEATAAPTVDPNAAPTVDPNMTPTP